MRTTRFMLAAACLGCMAFAAPAFAETVPAGAQLGATGTQVDTDLVFWTSIQNTQTPSELKLYLEKFPNGMFADLAKLRLEAASRAVAEPEVKKVVSTDPAPLVEADPTPRIKKTGPVIRKVKPVKRIVRQVRSPTRLAAQPVVVIKKSRRFTPVIDESLVIPVKSEGAFSPGAASRKAPSILIRDPASGGNHGGGNGGGGGSSGGGGGGGTGGGGTKSGGWGGG